MKPIYKRTQAPKKSKNNPLTNIFLEAEIKKTFANYYFIDDYFYIPLDDDKTKIHKIKDIKNHLNTNFQLYELSIVFTSGIKQDYKSTLKIKVLK